MSLVVAIAAAVIGWAATRPDDIAFERRMIDPGASETVAVADINGDGHPDIVSGEFWYEAPRWTKHRFRQIDFTNNYIDNFSDLALDVNGDGRVDIVSCPGSASASTGARKKQRARRALKDHPIETKSPVEPRSS
jgi:hypothetical protein